MDNKLSSRKWATGALLACALCAFHIHLKTPGVQAYSLTTNNETTSNGKIGNIQGSCPVGWMWFNNKCFMSINSRRDFTHAIELCKKMYNSTLPTIHSEDENEFLRQNTDTHNSPIWLYAKHDHQQNITSWLDRSPVNYTRWDSGQPSNLSSLICIKTEESWYMKKAEPLDGQTDCISFWGDAKWGTQVGCQVLLPVVCQKNLVMMSRLAQDLPTMETSLGVALSGASSGFHHTNYLPGASLILLLLQLAYLLGTGKSNFI